MSADPPPDPASGESPSEPPRGPVTWVTVCETCKREDWRAGDAETSGERLAALVEHAAGDGPVRVRRHACLMGCARACNVAVQGVDAGGRAKMSYTLGAFDPSAEAAEAIVRWAALHAGSEGGVVAYRQWPEPIKGHFVARHPPLPGR